jgi:SARP family transcriptional regulator, regulator of embCAB operon
VQLCGTFAVELRGRDVTADLPGRQGRALFAYLALAHGHPVPRRTLVDALWADSPPVSAAGALAALLSKLRTVVGPDVLRGRTDLALVLPEPAQIDVEAAFAALHSAESALRAGNWRRAWFASLGAQFVARRPLLPEVTAPWADVWRRRLADVRVGGLECYAAACLELGGSELPGAERAARELVDLAPLRETGHLLLMRAMAAAGNTAEALAVYARLREVLRDELGVDPGQDIQAVHRALLG